MTAPEVDFMQRLAPLAGRSPRELKRFVTTYRFVRATLDGRERGFLMGNDHTPGGFAALLTNLFVALSAPAAATEYFQALWRARDLDALWADLANEADASTTRRRILEALQTYRHATAGGSLDDLRRWSWHAQRHGWNAPL